MELWSSARFFDEPSNQQYSIIRFSGHASIDTTHPFQSGLIFDSAGNRNLLWASDLARLRLNAKMVTMAACETGPGVDVPRRRDAWTLHRLLPGRRKGCSRRYVEERRRDQLSLHVGYL